MPAASRPPRIPNRLSSWLIVNFIYFIILTKEPLFPLAGLLLLAGAGAPATGCAQPTPGVPVSVPVLNAISLVNGIAAQHAANREMAAKTTTTATYRGQTFLMKRTPADLLVGEATDRIEQLESQLALCRAALLADSTAPTCPPERRTAIREAITYLGPARPNWGLTAYHQELRFYVAEDSRRKKASR